MSRRRCLPLAPLLLLLALPACKPASLAIAGGAMLGPVALIGRTPVDVLVSVATRRDCSLVRLERGQSYCRPEEAPPAPPPYCTRSLGRVDCWRQPPLAHPLPAGVADGPMTLNAAQEADRRRGWPGLF